MKILGLNSPEIFIITTIILFILGPKRIEKGSQLFFRFLTFLLSNEEKINNSNLIKNKVEEDKLEKPIEEIKAEEVKIEKPKEEVKAEELKPEKLIEEIKAVEVKVEDQKK